MSRSTHSTAEEAAASPAIEALDETVPLDTNEAIWHGHRAVPKVASGRRDSPISAPSWR